MLKLFRRARASSTGKVEPPRTPPGARLYAVGDIHGRADLLMKLRERILADAAVHPEKAKTIIYLGDYIDRGPDSRSVLERLSDNPLPGFESIYLRGNHEQAMLAFMANPEVYASWLHFGGVSTLASYGVAGGHAPPGQLAQELERRLPDTHRRFLEGLPVYRVLGDYLFVHAGIRPGVPLAAQRPDDLLWIREDFTRFSGPHPYCVVHGHSMCDAPELPGNRIGVDTGAYATGRLTCVVLDGDGQRFIDTLDH